MHNETVEVRTAKWHPGSTNGSHLLILTFEDTFRLYKCEENEKPRMIKSWKIGRRPHISPSRIPNFTSLGETAVDFDFATPTVGKLKKGNTVHSWDQIEWPILVLRGNGEVLIIHGNVLNSTVEVPVMSSSLTMYPPADDNYGIDYCSIMCIGCTPPIVIIATCTGRIYHAMLLKVESKEDDIGVQGWPKQDTSCLPLYEPKEALFIYECIEIELGLFYTDTDEKYHCPIYLSGDDKHDLRYFCSHNAGIHMITVPMVLQLGTYINATHEDEDYFLPSLSNQSCSQYLICRRTKHTEADEATPILGFGLTDEPCDLIALLHTGDVVTRSIFNLFYFPELKLPIDVNNKNEKYKPNNDREDFDIHIKKLLQRETSQPIIKIGGKVITPRECLQLLCHATETFRKEHFVKHDAVREEIGKKTRALKVMKNHLLKELDVLMDSKEELQNSGKRLAKRYEDIIGKQKELALRAKEVLRLINFKKLSMSSIERAEGEELKKMELKIEGLKVNLLQLPRKFQRPIRRVTFSDNAQDVVHLKSKQEETIRKNLSTMTKDIEELISEVKKLDKDVST